LHKRSYYIVNGITLYRLLAAPFLVILILNNYFDLFKWLLAVSFLTDAIDGYLARRYKVVSTFGSRLDSIADDFTTLVAVGGIFFFDPEFIKEQMVVLIILLVLFLVQVTLAFIRYGRMTSFHTYGAKIATLFQGIFLLLFFFFPEPLYWLFYTAAIVTALELIEEIILILLLPSWQSDVKGLYWVFKKKENPG
jgi:CDP-diacylglycerol--glycerol-3-phosphate 3-phosphatidyltransferase